MTMEKMALDSDISTVISRLDRTTTESLLISFATEILRVQHHLSAMHARIIAMEVGASLRDSIPGATEGGNGTDLPRLITIEASFALSAEAGFYCLEYDNHGTPYRWTGPEPLFFFELLLDRSTFLNVHLRYLRLQVPAVGNAIRCYVDGKEVESIVTEKDGEFEISSMIPPREVSGATIIMFDCSRVQSPSEQGQSEDTRRLGLAFRWLKIAPDGRRTVSRTHASKVDR